MDRLLKTGEVAKILSVSVDTVKRIIDRGEIFVISTDPDRKGDRVELQELQNFIRRKKINRGLQCPSTKEKIVSFGTYTSKSTVNQSDDLLKRKIRKRQLK